MRDVSLSAPKFADFSDNRAVSSRRAKAPFPPDLGPARPQKERPALARFLRGPRLGVLVLSGIAGLALIGVPMNALFLQDGRHPAPLFGARVLTPEPIESATKATVSPAPAPAPHPARVEAARVEPDQTKAEPAPRAKPGKPQATSDAAALTAEILKSEAPSPAAPAKPVKKRETVASRDAIGTLLGGGAAAPVATPRPVPKGLQNGGDKAVASTPDPNILSAERALQRLGYVVKPDGLMSAELRKTIEKFERDNGLPPTGQLGPKVVKLLSARTAAQR